MGRVLEPEVMEGDDEAVAYDEFDRIWGEIIFQGFVESALRMGVSCGRVLDVGTGSGRLAIRLAKLNPELEIVGIDLSDSMLKLAERNAAREGVSTVKFLKADAKCLPFETNSVDMVISHQFLHQLADPGIALREINRVARRDGAILVRDVRRLPEPFMSLMLPIWVCRYSPRLRALATDSFRAGLTSADLRRCVTEAGIERARITKQLLTHISIERPANPRAPDIPRHKPSWSLARSTSWPVRLAKSFYVSAPD